MIYFLIYDTWQIPGLITMLCLILGNAFVLPLIISKSYKRKIIPFIVFSVTSIMFYLLLAIVPLLIFYLIGMIVQSYIRGVLNQNVNDYNFEFYVFVASYLLALVIDYFVIQKIAVVMKRKIEQTNPYLKISRMHIVKVYSTVTAFCSVEAAIMETIIVSLAFFK